ncbi:phosphotransferase family protein [Streptomyces endophyticus]|uniref:Aminoglycoside phosphotransferase family protein n=1 Tax=Streptomyces endophyticus TaxID=714166 RepID=A0ABU6FA02_9ACTN|nr:aminoglycoside phosphotransferase family protein [Streptomyces endophyticus]MEB8340870.1 aminoglycoside phosphotransferase family protein [Streptomyces endophyticus]
MDHDETADESATVRPSTSAWVERFLEAGERVARVEALHGGVTAEMRRLTVAVRGGGTRELVLRSYVDPFFVDRAEDALDREAGALALLAGASDVTAPGLIAADPTAAHCEYPSLLMTHLPGRTFLGDERLETRVRLMARQLVAIHAVHPDEQPPKYEALSTADTIVVPEGADSAAWAAAIDIIRAPAPPYEGRFLHRDLHPGNVLFDAPPTRITGVVDWAGASWGPTDLDVAHCCTNLALLHGPEWGQRFADAYEDAGGALADDAGARLYWRVRDALAFSEEVHVVARPWREAGRTELTTRVVEGRLDAYVTELMSRA